MQRRGKSNSRRLKDGAHVRQRQQWSVAMLDALYVLIILASFYSFWLLARACNRL